MDKFDKMAATMFTACALAWMGWVTNTLMDLKSDLQEVKFQMRSPRHPRRTAYVLEASLGGPLRREGRTE